MPDTGQGGLRNWSGDRVGDRRDASRCEPPILHASSAVEPPAAETRVRASGTLWGLASG